MGGHRLRIVLAALALGGGFQAIGAERAAFGSVARTEQEGGIFRVVLNTTAGIDSMDPALASSPPGWALLDTTCARLMAYPDKPLPEGFRLQPEVAEGPPRVSRDGRTYTFRLRSGFRFSDGKPLRANAFARAINRALAPEMDSPGVQYMRDIVGAGQVLAGKSAAATGVVARGNTLVIKLTRPAPDLPHRTASTFFCAVPPTLPIDPEGAGAFPAAGPYHVAEYRRGERVVIRKNTFYGGSRPHHVDGFDVDLRAASPQEVPRRVDRGGADWGYTLAGIYFDPSLGLVEKYAIQPLKVFLKPGLTLRMLAFNMSRPLFRDNPGLRRAVNFALNRRALVSTGGTLVSRPKVQYLPTILPGFKDANVYPLERADVQRARALANGNLRDRKAVLYVNSSPLPLAIGQLVRSSPPKSGSKSRCEGSRSTAHPPRTSRNSRQPASRGTSRSVSGAPATSIRSRTSTCSSTGGSSGARTSPASRRARTTSRCVEPRACRRGATATARMRHSTSGSRANPTLRTGRLPQRADSRFETGRVHRAAAHARSDRRLSQELVDVGGACAVTQRNPSANAMPDGAAPISIVDTTSFVPGSIREMLPQPRSPPTPRPSRPRPLTDRLRPRSTASRPSWDRCA